MDQWVKIESSRLQWVKSNQRTIRAEKYQGLYDPLLEVEMVNVGRLKGYHLSHQQCSK